MCMCMSMYTATQRCKHTHPPLAKIGHFVYNCIRKAIVLSEVQRQTGGAADRFIQCLNRCREGTMYMEEDSDVQFLSERYFTMLPLFERERFLSTDVPLIAAESLTVQQHNTERLLACGKPICVLKSVDIGNNNGGRANMFGGLEPNLSLCDDARVLLIRNLASIFGLVNGSFGYLRGLVYAPVERYNETQLPLYALVEFDTYKGPKFITIYI
eukprot:GHVR01001795.1.p1 GENE.GHVR01001795.1~~GHVR01001795.1.p1  ORF type:complete len:213 (+),score=18.10 GHVR01001795.1:1134-1772(+)